MKTKFIEVKIKNTSGKMKLNTSSYITIIMRKMRKVGKRNQLNLKRQQIVLRAKDYILLVNPYVT